MEHIVTIGDAEVSVKEPMRHVRDRYWEWEYWALKEHMAASHCESIREYILNVVMTYDMPTWNESLTEIDARPRDGDAFRSVFIHLPLKVFEMVRGRKDALLRNWRSFLLYPAFVDGVIAIHKAELKKDGRIRS